MSSDAEWDAVFAQPPEMLAGSTLVVSGDNFTQRSITDCDLSAFAQPLTIRSADPNARLPSLQLNGTVRGIDFSGVNFQMTGWPHTYGACIVFGSGTFGKLRFLNGTTFRHGYGADLTDFATDVDLPEYERVDNVHTATTTSSAHPLTWLDPTAPTGWIEFFNR
ncbi:MAG: hypothetical protein V2I43_00745, partial [Parvularcula sp.]|nr:hypothetical protein [Parvularcula sp.]